jgi:phosphoglycolate phosphatase-like HAD superfamily hydrolase
MREHMTTLITWDIDGTILHDGKNYGDWRCAAPRLGIPVGRITEDANLKLLAAEYGHDLQAAYEIVWEERAKAGRTWITAFDNGECYLYPDVMPTLDRLTQRGFEQHALATRSNWQYTFEKLSRMPELAKYFMMMRSAIEPWRVFVTSVDTTLAPDKSNEIREAVMNERYRERPVNLVYHIGDSEDDIVSGHRASEKLGIDVRPVLVNRREKKIATRPYAAISRISDLVDVL